MHRFEPTGSQMEADSFAYRVVHLQKLEINSLDYFAGKASLFWNTSKICISAIY